MTDAELEQLIADKEYAWKESVRLQREADKWSNRWYGLSHRVELALQADNSEFVRQVKEG